MGIYTYEVDDDAFFETLIYKLKHNSKSKSEKKILELINYGKCKIIPDYPEVPIHTHSRIMGIVDSQIRYAEQMESYNRYKDNSIIISATACFSVLDMDSKVTTFMENKLINFCNDIISPSSGLKVDNINFEQLIVVKNSNLLNIEESIKHISKKIIKEILPLDIREKGEEMAEIYLYLYHVENSLRLFIEKIAKEKYGNSYFERLNTNSKIKNSIKNRRKNELKKKWMGIRGDSELFYLDFKDLGTLIRENWDDLFKDYFPDQGFIIPKINEMADIRNIIAHNGYILKNQRDKIKLYYEDILDQLDGNFEE